MQRRQWPTNACSKPPSMLKTPNASRYALLRVSIGGREGSGLGGPCGLWRSKLGAEHLVPKTTGDSKAVLIVRIMMLKVVVLELFVVGWKAVIAISIKSRSRGSTILALRDGGSNGSGHSKCSQKCLHKIQLLLHTNRRKKRCGRACKKVWQGR